MRLWIIQRKVSKVIFDLVKASASLNTPLASDIARAPDLKEARVHKCFLALANRKLITKDPTSVRVMEIFTSNVAANET